MSITGYLKKLLTNTLGGYIILVKKIPQWGILEIERIRKLVEGNNKAQECGCHHKTTPRQEKELKQLKNRLNRMVGQLNGISKMLEDNRYCGDILTQVAAVESALQAFGYLVLKEHMETCVVEEIKKDNVKIVDEAVELIKKLK